MEGGGAALEHAGALFTVASCPKPSASFPQRRHPRTQEYKNIGRAFIAMCTFLAGNADLNTLYKDAHNPGGLEGRRFGG